MGKTSPKSHLVRLGLVGLLAAIVIFIAGFLASPASWNYEIANWYRLDALKDVAALPQAHGGNETCGLCHTEKHETLLAQRHKSLACESCHAPLVDHIKDGEKVAEMRRDRSPGLCLGCHRALVSRPKDFPQFSSVGGMEDVTEEDTCIMCHNPHEPKLGGN